MSVYKQPKSKNWWYKFTFNGELIRESTKQPNQRIARQMEAAHKASLAKGEVGIRDRKPGPTLKAFAQTDFLPYVEVTFASKLKTRAYYQFGVKSLLGNEALSGKSLDTITSAIVAGYVGKRQEAELRLPASIVNCRSCDGCFILRKSGARLKKCFRKFGCCRASAIENVFSRRMKNESILGQQALYCMTWLLSCSTMHSGQKNASD